MRTHARLLCRIWQNRDFTALDVEAQHAYMLLLSQPKLSLVGVLDYVPRRWALLIAGYTEERFDAAVRRLEAAGFVAVDETTDELLILTFAKHDGIKANNKNLRLGVWSAWSAIASETLRQAALDHMPTDMLVWDEAPVDIAQTRRSVPLKPPVRPAVEPPSAFPLSPYPSPDRPSNEAPVNNSTEAHEDEGGDGELIRRVVNAVAKNALATKMASTDPAKNPDGWLSWWLQENAEGCAIRVRQLLDDYDGMSESQLIAAATTTRGQAPPWMRQYERRGNVVDVDFGASA